MTEALDLDVAANADWDAGFAITGADGQPAAIGGGHALMQLRRAPGDTSVAFELSTANGRLTVPDDVTGQVLLHVSYAEVGGLAGDYAYDLLLAANGRHLRPYAGTVRVAAGVTRWPVAAG